ncbi:MAG: sirohydrochlorin cobaltochelatase [Deltaproteobacteria bacterium]|nr:sirohydrochlorin cobaltochelatase [Candidatus Anaeroferrophillacea bacterium]
MFPLAGTLLILAITIIAGAILLRPAACRAHGRGDGDHHAHGHGHGHGRGAPPDRDGILLVAFGTSIPQARAALDNIERRARERFPETDIRWAWTSSMIRRKLARRGEVIDSPLIALAKMKEEGFTRVAVQSLHTIPGVEFHQLRETVDIFRRGHHAFGHISLGPPLLASHADLERAVDGVIAAIPPERRVDEAVVLMGHGSERHAADLLYRAAAAAFAERDPLVLLGSVEGHPDLDEILARCRERQIRKAWLLPFMSVAGDHARNDLAGDDDDSWKSVLARHGIESIPMLRGTAENDRLVDIWLDHLQAARERIS